MNKISQVDKNFSVETSIQKEDIKFYNIDDEPFKIYGIFKEGGKYRRMPESVAKTVSDGVYYLHSNTSGGRVRFKTDSKYIAINSVMENLGKMPHFTFAGSIGFDLYADNVYIRSYVPPIDVEDGYEGIIEFEDRELRDIIINFPLYSDVKNLYIGLEESAQVKPGDFYKNEKPVVYYGNSITQGGCASRAGMSYPGQISRALDIDFVNLGFSGNAKGEVEIAEYIKDLPMSMLIYDYDHNAPTLEHLLNTHERMFKIIREANPDLPIIMMNRPRYYLDADSVARYELIKTNYENALKSGDKNVYFVDNKALTKICKKEGTVDMNHPTDFGFYSIAQALIEVMKDIPVK